MDMGLPQSSFFFEHCLRNKKQTENCCIINLIKATKIRLNLNFGAKKKKIEHQRGKSWKLEGKIKKSEGKNQKQTGKKIW